MTKAAENPYQAPESDITPADSEVETIRLTHLGHEAAIKSIGLLYYFSAFAVMLSAAAYAMQISIEPIAVNFTFALGLLGLGIFQFWIAVQVRRLRSSARIPIIIFSIIGLMGFPIGTVISAYILYVILCKKGRYILSEEYAEIVRATPDIKHHTSIVIWLLLIFFLMFIAAVMIPTFA